MPLEQENRTLETEEPNVESSILESQVPLPSLRSLDLGPYEFKVEGIVFLLISFAIICLLRELIQSFTTSYINYDVVFNGTCESHLSSIFPRSNSTCAGTIPVWVHYANRKNGGKRNFNFHNDSMPQTGS
jgi:hypothetical protein